jgi:hypothetical protein
VTGWQARKVLPSFFTGLWLVVGKFHEFPKQVAKKTEDENNGEHRHEKNALSAGKELSHEVSLLV